MSNVYEARRSFIDKVGKKMIELKNTGHVIINIESGDIIDEITQTGFSDDNFGLNIDHTVYYEYNKELDNGYYTSITKLKKMLSKFKAIKPEDVIDII